MTIGIPTFNRTHTIRRALLSLARQNFRDFVVIISDNAGVSQATVEVVRDIADNLPEVYLIAQPNNIGALPNMNILLGCASTDYFMWLADDDEISENWLEELVTLLETDPTAVTAMGGWYMMTNENEGHRIRQLEISARNRAARIFKYIAGESDDSFFYGLHRTDILRTCKFRDYLYPNAGVLTNWCYVFLFDMIWHGPVRYTPNANWIYHVYSEKQYNKALAAGIGDRAKTLMRRANIYFLYCAKTAQKGPHLLFVCVPAAIIGFSREIVSALVRVASRRLVRSKGV